jgi:hypothetical protein
MARTYLKFTDHRQRARGSEGGRLGAARAASSAHDARFQAGEAGERAELLPRPAACRRLRLRGAASRRSERSRAR